MGKKYRGERILRGTEEKKKDESEQVLIFTNKNSIVIAISKMLHKKFVLEEKKFIFDENSSWASSLWSPLENGMIINHNLCVLVSFRSIGIFSS